MGVCQTKVRNSKRQNTQTSQTQIRIRTEVSEISESFPKRRMNLQIDPTKISENNKTSPLSEGILFTRRAKRRITLKKQGSNNYTATTSSSNHILLPACAFKKYSLIRKKQGNHVSISCLLQSISIISNNKTGKIMQLETFPKDDPECTNYIEWLMRNKIDHPNIIRVSEIFQDNKYYQVVSEHFEDNDLSDLIVDGSKLSKPQVSQVVNQMLQAIHYLHEQQIYHGAITINSFSYQKKLDGIIVKLSNLKGAVIKVEDDIEVLKYTSPECIYQPQQNEARDVWAIALIGLTLKKGGLPYQLPQQLTQEKIRMLVKNNTFKFEHKKDQAFKEFLSSSLNKNPLKRIKVEQLLNLPFLTRYQLKQKSEQEILLNNLLEAKPSCLLQQLILGFFVQEFNWEEYLQIQKLFLEGDVDMDGLMTKTGLVKLFNKYLTIDKIEEKIDNLYKELEIDDKINSNLFLALTATRKDVLSISNIEICFEIFSLNSSEINLKGLKKYLNSDIDEIKVELTRLTENQNSLNYQQFSKILELMI
ncbi:unnamed protein product (macronuclear) [Paramecium tetraurelia]|uniref:Protein kinase domain-containing protein n=1 Tax=Paramecium tetraurelia TaxID=5888 RepID=A0DX50_PARTE|nr:uncharacterized protein GSPATT00021249001 [Paramecium tetraurelia]CAK87617.1 unnamed protein product [Paramecium tetraurelia]|eukprot:XP_001455014.1 hypothetical protein (macronuclear) [Paramecium tetraurelia strain d4-2]